MMTEEERDGRRHLALPVSVSPEFGNTGKNASFQLAACHLLATLLPRAAAILGKPADPRWERVRTELPAASTVNLARLRGRTGPTPRLALWEGQDLPESHRHHSHLAGIFPFCTIDRASPEGRELIAGSLERWMERGAGLWVGWSMPWASLIWTRADEATAAVTSLRIFEDVFVSDSGTPWDYPDSPGYASWAHAGMLGYPEGYRRDYDIMQMDAAMGFLHAITEIFVQQRGEDLHVLPSLPRQWRDFSCDGILAEGGFLVGATVKARRPVEIRVTSRAGGPLRLVHGLGEGWTLDAAPRSGARIELATTPGQVVVLRAARA